MNEKTISGKLTMSDPDFSFGYDAGFSAPVFEPELTPGRSVDANMSNEEQAKIGSGSKQNHHDEDLRGRENIEIPPIETGHAIQSGQRGQQIGFRRKR
jgi:hypothetical protein